MKQFSKFVDCIFQIGSQSYHKSLAQLCHQELAEQSQHFKTFMVQQGFQEVARNIMHVL